MSSTSPQPMSTFAKAYLPLALAVGVLSATATGYVLYKSMLVLGPHMPAGAFTIFAVPDTPGGNPQKLYESYRIFFVHLPSALASMTVSIIMALAGILYFISKHRRWEALVVSAAETGVAACFATIATGYLWGEFAWGMGWTWEPRLVSALILWLSYIALLLLRFAIDDPRKRALFTAAYGLLTVPLYPLVSRSIEMFGRVSHPASLNDLLGNDNEISALLNIAKPAVIGLFLFIMMVRYWQHRLGQETVDVRAAFSAAREARK